MDRRNEFVLVSCAFGRKTREDTLLNSRPDIARIAVQDENMCHPLRHQLSRFSGSSDQRLFDTVLPFPFNGGEMRKRRTLTRRVLEVGRGRSHCETPYVTLFLCWTVGARAP